ncbi:MAG: NAD synthetase [Halobacteriovoraceae bacterium]|nr:NAD synthetase [Halobacteriovoraceae bacterium]
MDRALIINLAYILAAFFFVNGLKKLGHPSTARKGNMHSSLGMLIAILASLVSKEILSYQMILIGMVVGSIVGVLAAKLIKMTAMPEMVALLNGFGGISSLLVGWGAYASNPSLTTFTAATVALSVIIGGITLTGSLIAWGKLSETLSGKPVLFVGQKLINAALLITSFCCAFAFATGPSIGEQSFFIMAGIALLLGILLVIPIGGADMPVVIALLNSYSGIAASAAGFVVNNNLLIVAGAIVGASGLILTNIMCKAMNRTLAHVLFGGMGATSTSGDSKDVKGEVKPIVPEDAALILEAAQSVSFIPGYGMAVAQAQHSVKELAELLENNGCEVKFGIHPVAGRMPGHMNVLLAEADIPYEQLFEMDAINPSMESTDVCVVIGANDVVNPDARESEGSPIYGMPIINADYAKTVIILKRSMASGFAGIANPLFLKNNARMLFGDAKSSIHSLISYFKES